MTIVVCAKHVPDIHATRRFTPQGRVDRSGGTINEVDENALEAALTLAEGREVVVLTMGPPPAVDAVRRGLQMGADRGVLVSDPALAGSDAFATAIVLAAAVRRIGGSLVLMGMAALDSLTSLLPVALATTLDWPALTLASRVAFDDDGDIRVYRDLDHATEYLTASLPAVVSVTDGINVPRLPHYQGILAARTKPVETWTLADLGVSPTSVGAAAARTEVLDASERPARTDQVLDSGDGAAERLADYLVQRGLA